MDKLIRRIKENPRNVRFEIIIEPNNEGGFYVRVPDIPSIFTGGGTELEAIKKAKAAITEYIDICEKDGLPVPQPKSGKFNVRVPKDLHRRFARKAQEEGVSLNQMVTYLLCRSLGVDLTKAYRA